MENETRSSCKHMSERDPRLTGSQGLSTLVLPNSDLADARETFLTERAREH
jgi:hypothetical protein